MLWWEGRGQTALVIRDAKLARRLWSRLEFSGLRAPINALELTGQPLRRLAMLADGRKLLSPAASVVAGQSSAARVPGAWSSRTMVNLQCTEVNGAFQAASLAL